MSINNIKKLSMNPHFYSLLMQSFLSGYEKPCEIKLPFMAIPILLYAESREKLVNANRRYMVNNSSSRKRYASPKAGTELYLDLVFRQ